MDAPPPVNSPSTPRNIYVFGLTSFLNDTASEMAYWVLPAFLASLGAGPAQLGIIEGVAESVASFAKLFSGYVTDRVSERKPIVVAGYIVANAVKPLLALVSSWWQILGIRFSDRFAKGIRGTARDVMVAESVDNANLGSAYGLIQALDSAGAIAGPLLALIARTGEALGSFKLEDGRRGQVADFTVAAGSPLVGRDLSDAIRAAEPAAPSEPILFTTDDEISEGSMKPASPFQRVARIARVYATVKQPNHLQTVIAEVPVDGEQHLIKFSRYYDNPQFWTVPGERDERLHGRKTTTVTEPEPDEYELYDLTLDPTEERNLAHPSHADDHSHALQQTMLGLLIEQLAAKRLTPSTGDRPRYRRPAIT